jgi:hypothetical protein
LAEIYRSKHGSPKKEATFGAVQKTPLGKEESNESNKREQETPHSAAQGRRARSSADLVGVVGGVGVGAGGGIGAGAGADEDLEAAVLGARHGAGGSRPAAVSVRQVSRSALLRGRARARAFLESGGGTGRQWSVDGRSAPSMLACSLAAVPVQLSTAFLIFFGVGGLLAPRALRLLFPLLASAFLYPD